jgi:hypothetical protein
MTSAVVDDDGWSERYGCYSKRYGRLITLSFDWQKDMHVMQINGLRLTSRKSTALEAKKYLLINAIGWCERAVKMMKEDLDKLEARDR